MTTMREFRLIVTISTLHDERNPNPNPKRKRNIVVDNGTMLRDNFTTLLLH